MEKVKMPLKLLKRILHGWGGKPWQKDMVDQGHHVRQKRAQEQQEQQHGGHA